MSLSFFLKSSLREARGSGGRLLFFIACLAIGVAAVVGVSALIGTLRHGMAAGSRELLAADVMVEGRRPLPDGFDAPLSAFPGSERTDILELASMVSVPEGSGAAASQLGELKAVGPGYPFYGTVELDPPGRLEDFLDEESVVVAPDLLSTLGLDLGDEVEIGGQRFTIKARVLAEPDRLDFSLVIGPRVLMSREGLERADLVRFGSRVVYRALFKLPEGTPRDELLEIEESLEAAHSPWLRVTTHDDSQPVVRRALERVESYLGLVALVSLVLGGIGVAQIVRAWIAGRTQSIAVLRCLGLRPRDILILYLGQIAVLAFIGSLVGAMAGAAAPSIVLRLVPSLAAELGSAAGHPIQFAALLEGVALGVGLALAFAVPPLTELWRVSPQRVLRAGSEPLPPQWIVRVAAGVVLFVGVTLSAYSRAGDLTQSLAFGGGLFVVAVILALLARLVSWAARRMPREGWNAYVRHGVASLARPGAGTTGAIVALGLGCTVVLAIDLIEGSLDRRLRTALPDDAPSTFLIDIQPEQWGGVKGRLEAAGASSVEAVPVVVSRLSRLRGQAVEDIVGRTEEGRRDRWVLTREQRMTWRKELPASNTLVAGSLWSRPDVDEVSLEEDFARDLGVGIGDHLVFDIEGIPVELVVTSLRRVEWESFAINFFVVVEPGVLDDAPSFRIAAARLGIEDELRLQNDLARAFPNVSVLRVRPIIERVLGVMHQLAVAVRLLGGFTVLAGLAILIGTAVAASLSRAREVALLKTLGVTPRGVVGLLAVEYALCGFVAGLAGAIAAYGLAAAFVDRVLDVPPGLPWLPLPTTIVLAAAATALAGLFASTRALRVRPVELLRSA